MGQLQLWKDAAHQRQLTLNQQMETIASLTNKLQNAQFDYIAAVQKPIEQGKRLRSLLEQLQIKRGTVAIVVNDVKIRKNATKTSEVPSLYRQLMVPIHAPIDSITRRIRKQSLLCHPAQGGTQEAFVRQQRARRIRTDRNARNVKELEGCEAADNDLGFKNNPGSWMLLSLGRQLGNNFLTGPGFVFAFLFWSFLLLRWFFLKGNTKRHLKKLFWKKRLFYDRSKNCN